MRIGIITFHKAVNYGAVLQTYALQKKLEDLSIENDIIDYKCKKINDVYRCFDIRQIQSIKRLIFNIAYCFIIAKKNRNFRMFINKYLSLSNKLNCKDELNNINTKYKKFITGSDQVWNLNCTGNDTSYFLDFVDHSNKKNSYSASFGVSNISYKDKEIYRKLLKDFNHISVREKQGADIVKELTGKEAMVHLDPTLLLTNEQWKDIYTSRNKYGNYILIYLMAYSNSIIKFANELSQRTGCKIINISSELIPKNKGKYIRTAGPDEFLNLFANAEYVVTNSFRGTAFSINFNKKFFVELLPPPSKVNSRLENILDLVNLRSRQIIDGKNDNIDIPIDYERVNKILEVERKKSVDYLKSIVEECNE